MSYTKPRLVIDNRLGEAYIENVKKIGSDIAQTVTSTVQQAKAKRDANFKITREIDNYQSQLELGLAKVAIENKVDVNSFLSGQKAAASEFKQRNLRLSQATEEYDGYEEDQRFVSQYKTYVAAGAQQQAAAITSVTEMFNNTLVQRGVGSKPGQISAYDTDPRWLIANDITKSGNNSSGTIRYETIYSGDAGGFQNLVVVEGDAILKANKDLYEKTGDKKYLEAGNKYTISAQEIYNSTTKPGASPYNYGAFAINPDIIGSGKEGDVGIKDDFIKTGLIDKSTGNITADFKTPNKTIVKSEIVGGQEKSYYAQVVQNDYAKIASIVSPSSSAFVDGIMNLKGPEVNNFVQSYAESRQLENGDVEYFYKPIKMENGVPAVDANGNVVEGKEVILGDSGIMERDFNENTEKTYGYTKDQYDQIQGLALKASMKHVGALNPPQEVDGTTRKYIETNSNTKNSEGANLIANALMSNLQLLENKDYAAMNFDELSGYKGLTVEIEDIEKPNLLTVYKTNNKGEKVSIKDEIDISDPELALQQLYSEFGIERLVAGASDKKPTPKIVSDLISPVLTFDNNISEESFMSKLNDNYFSTLSELGISIDESSPGSDVIAITRDDGKVVEIDLEEADWKSEYKKAISDAVTTSSKYKEEEVVAAEQEKPNVNQKIPVIKEANSTPVIKEASPKTSEKAEGLLEYISSGEGGLNSSNRGTSGSSIVGSTNKTVRGGKQLSEMTIGEIMKYQSINDPKNEDRLFAVGQYQVIPDTMKQAVKGLGLNESAIFDQQTQDNIGMWIIKNKRGKLGDYIDGGSVSEDEALLELAKEFASFPVPYDMKDGKGNNLKAGESYYKYSGGNKANHSVEESKAILRSERKK